MALNKSGVMVLMAGFAACVASFQVYLFVSNGVKDSQPPEITFDSSTIQVSVEDDQDVLLQGVSAWDNKDGDVTELLVVERISAITSDHTAQVTYAAFDRAGNVTKAERTVTYKDYTSPKFQLSQPLVFASGTSFDVFRYVHAIDVLDGSLDSRLKATLVSGDSVISAEGVHDVEFRVTNSMGDTVSLVIPVEVYPTGAYRGTVKLSENLVYLPRGSSFDPMEYLEEYQVGDVRYTDVWNDAYVSVHVAGDSVDTGTPGVYSVSYTVMAGNDTGYTRLTVVVEE